MKKLLKPVLGLAILAYAWHAKILDLSSIRAAWDTPGRAVLALGLMGLSNLMLATRWFVLLRAQSLPLGWARVQQIHWATAFLSLVLPGSVGADMAKVWYAVADAPERKSAAVMTILADRVVGSSTLLLIGALALAWFRADLQVAEPFAWLARVFWLGAAVLFAGYALLFLFARRTAAWVVRLERFVGPRLTGLVARVVESLLIYRARPSILLLAALCSAGSVAATVALSALEAQRLGIGLSAARFWYVVPVVSLAGYFSFLPLGLGVGQVVYFHLFSWIGVARPALGAALSTLMQIYMLVLNLAGGAAFLWKRPVAPRQETARAA